MNLDFFKNLENKSKNTEAKDLVNKFTNELKHFLENGKENQEIKTLGDIEKEYGLTYEDSCDLVEKRNEILKIYANELKDGENLYYVSYKNESQETYKVLKFNNKNIMDSIYLSKEELPKNITKDKVIKKLDNKFIIDNETTKYIINKVEDVARKLTEEKNNKQNNYIEENCLYQVIELTRNGVYLQNTRNNETFEETNISQELKGRLGNDYILRYKNGEYVYEQEITDDFFSKLVSIDEYKKIQENFIKESNIENIPSNTSFAVKERQEDYTILSYQGENILKVPNALIPYFANDTSILYYKNGKFQKD